MSENQILEKLKKDIYEYEAFLESFSKVKTGGIGEITDKCFWCFTNPLRYCLGCEEY